ncbi:alpha/beta fold hydrolase [Emticicia sp. BO119]|uniref:alpha/beta fold hydrolase n=1 Tax=Emticicia sp. BO119 TaxID=2757768 RepID=UPI0015F07C7B|nr:alpha/beta hydrolase [Emticicia sp. BO119]MBA4850873.1 alpha/beta hydrolase [Emticicia sp. BO119]
MAKQIILIIFAAFLSSNLSGQQIPTTIDWFLRTGSSQNSPQLYVKEMGMGKDTIVMLHGGWGGAHDELVDAVRNLGSQFHFIFYEQRGSLRSPCADSLISFDAHIEDLERLRKELGIQKMIVVGHSMGGLLAGAYASRYPERIKKLILLAPAYLKEPLSKGDIAILSVSRPAFESFLVRPDIRAELEKYNLTGDNLNSRQETFKNRINLCGRMVYDVSNWKKFQGGGPLFKFNVYNLTTRTYPPDGFNFFTALQKTGFPIRVIMGDNDFLDFGNTLMPKWYNEIPNSRFISIKNAGHLLWFDQPEAFEKALKESIKAPNP